MIQLSEATAIAIHSVIYMIQDETKVSRLNEIADFFTISPNHLSKVLQRLVRIGYVESIKGPKGGFSLKRTNLTLMDIYEAIEGKYNRVDCLFAEKHNSPCCCAVAPMLKTINDTFQEYMTSHIITEFKLGKQINSNE